MSTQINGYVQISRNDYVVTRMWRQHEPFAEVLANVVFSSGEPIDSAADAVLVMARDMKMRPKDNTNILCSLYAAIDAINKNHEQEFPQ